jgi:UDP-N-acetylmuramoyl-tripeptide--D-alanyl-D-alanine ligase
MHLMGREIAPIVGGDLIGSGDRLAQAAVNDNRKLAPGLPALFAALAGEKADGHDYVPAAAAAGAPVALINRRHAARLAYLADRIDLVAVNDVQAALWKIAAHVRSGFDGLVLALTGSFGKTTTKNMLQTILAAAFGKGCVTTGNMNNLLGVPLTVLGLAHDDRFLLLELGTNSFGEIARLASLARPRIAIVTGIGAAHLEGFGDLAGVLREKGDLPRALGPDGVAVFPSFDALLLRDCKGWPGEKATYGYRPEDLVRIVRLEDGTRASGRLQCRRQAAEVCLTAAGAFNVHNAASAVTAAVVAGVDFLAACEAVQAARMEAMRMERLEWRGATILLDAYNANPDTMKAALKTLAAQKADQRICVIGEMRELGAGSDALHRQVGKAAAEAGIDGMIAVGEAGRLYAEGAKEAAGSLRVTVVPGHAEAAAALAEAVRPGCVVMIKGSRGARMETVVAELRKLDAGANAAMARG